MDRLTDKSIELVDFIKSHKVVDKFDINNDTISNIRNVLNKDIPEYYKRVKTSTIESQTDPDDPPIVFNIYKEIKDIRKVIPTSSITTVETMLSNNDHDSFIEWYFLNHRYLEVPYDIGKKEIDKLEYPSTLKKSLYGSPFMAIDIQKYFESHKFFHTRCTCKFTEWADIIIDLYEPFDHRQIDIDEIIKICSMMRLFKPRNAKVPIYLTLISSHLKKKLGRIADQDILLPKHVNSASTMRGEFIYIWRYEEWKKVLIHELIHYLQIDFGVHETGFDELVDSLQNNFKVEGNLFPFESYTEIVAILIHSVYVSNNLGIDLEEILVCELNFSLFQCAKILKYIGFDDLTTFITPSIDSDSRLAQMTGTLSYFFLKTSLLNNNKSLFRYLGSSVVFRGKNLEDYKRLLFESIQKESLNNRINRYLSDIDSITENERIRLTMRMSCVQY